MNKDEELAREIEGIIETDGNRDVMVTVKMIMKIVRRVRNEYEGDKFSANPREWFCKHCRPIADEHLKQVSRNVRNEALEEAAKTAGETTMVFKGAWITNDVREFREQIAEAIRQLKREG